MSEVAPFVGGGATTDRAQAADDTEAVAAQLIRRVLAASEDLDPIGLQDKLDVAASFIGLARCILVAEETHISEPQLPLPPHADDKGKSA